MKILIIGSLSDVGQIFAMGNLDTDGPTLSSGVDLVTS